MVCTARIAGSATAQTLAMPAFPASCRRRRFPALRGKRDDRSPQRTAVATSVGQSRAGGAQGPQRRRGSRDRSRRGMEETLAMTSTRPWTRQVVELLSRVGAGRSWETMAHTLGQVDELRFVAGVGRPTGRGPRRSMDDLRLGGRGSAPCAWWARCCLRREQSRHARSLELYLRWHSHHGGRGLQDDGHGDGAELRQDDPIQPAVDVSHRHRGSPASGPSGAMVRGRASSRCRCFYAAACRPDCPRPELRAGTWAAG